MPYIKKEKRIELDNKMSELLIDCGELSDGELNYIISNLLNVYLEQKKQNNKFNYSECNKLVGVLECAKLEFYNRLVTPYENIKIVENGDLYKKQSNALFILQTEHTKIKEQIEAYQLIYSLHECDSWENKFRDTIPELEDTLAGIEIAINNMN